MIELELPYPPSVNHYWKHVRGRVVLSAGGRRYQEAVAALLAKIKIKKLKSRLYVYVTIHPPDRRRRDIDNLMKALLDSLQHAGLYEDDSQVDDLHLRRGEPYPGGKLIVRVGKVKCT